MYFLSLYTQIVQQHGDILSTASAGLGFRRHGSSQTTAFALQTQYGLIQRSRDASEAASSAGAGAENGGTRDWELAKFKSDMERLPEVTTLCSRQISCAAYTPWH